jgi:hypothetical protein
MPGVRSHLHEVLIEMFRDRPALAAELLDGPLGVPVPDFKGARLSAAELTDVAPTEYRADAAVTLDGDGSAVLAVVVEVQLRVDAPKRRSWPAAAQDCLEELMSTTTHRYQSDFARRYFSQDEAEAVLRILDARGVAVPDEIRANIAKCTDLDQLSRWIRRAATADKIQDLDDQITG